jgi:phosphoribosylanthranilate isomerase
MPTSVPARIKICGITREEDAKLAVNLGAWALGYIFFEKSPRVVDPVRVRAIVESLIRAAAHNIELHHVGVFVNSDITAIASVIEKSAINAIQLHGDESPLFCVELKKRFPKVLLIKAFQLQSESGNETGNEKGVEQLEKYRGVCDHLLIDSYALDQRGGIGKLADWPLAVRAKAFGSVILAGGLNSENIRNAIETVKPFAVDVSSGVESQPGIKSPEKLHKLFEACIE